MRYDRVMKGTITAVLVAMTGVAMAGDPTAAEIKQCDGGKGKVCLDIGQRYINAKDEAKALPFYVKACKANVALGCGYAGTMTLLGQGTTADVPKGRALREKACTLNDGGSCNDLGTSWSEGKEGAPSVDHNKARGYYEKACKLGDGLGCFNLGNIFREGEGTKPDLKKAFDFFKKSCDLSQARGCTELGIMYFEGKAITKDKEKSIEMLEKACKLGSQVACKNVEIIRKQP